MRRPPDYVPLLGYFSFSRAFAFSRSVLRWPADEFATGESAPSLPFPRRHLRDFGDKIIAKAAKGRKAAKAGGIAATGPPDAVFGHFSFRAFMIRSLLLGGRESDPGAGCEPVPAFVQRLATVISAGPFSGAGGSRGRPGPCSWYAVFSGSRWPDFRGGWVGTRHSRPGPIRSVRPALCKRSPTRASFSGLKNCSSRSLQTSARACRGQRRPSGRSSDRRPCGTCRWPGRTAGDEVLDLLGRWPKAGPGGIGRPGSSRPRSPPGWLR